LEHTVTSTQETPPSSPATFSPAPPAPDARESAPAKRPRLLLALAALLVIAVVAVGVLTWRTNTAGRLISAKADAVAAARIVVPEVLSYNTKDVDAQVARSRSLVSGAFAARFLGLLDQVVNPAVKGQGMVTKAEVVRCAATEDAAPENVVVLMFVRQTTTLGKADQPAVGINGFKVTMSHANGKWLISNILPV
jgi:Mce-associated membrane protein